MKRLIICLVALMCAAAAPPQSDIARLIASKHRPSPQVRHVSNPHRGLVCGEVRWIAPAGRYGSWLPFHIINGHVAVGEFYPEIWSNAPFPGQAEFERAHRACGGANMPPPPPTALERSRPILLTTFPKQMLEDRWSGEVRVKITVGTNGRVIACKVTKSSGHAALDARTCRTFAAQARFKPSTDKAGKPVQADVPALIDWQLAK